MKYKVHQFILVNSEEGLIIQNKFGINILKDKNMTEMFETIDQDNRLIIDEKYMRKFITNNYEESLCYLIENNLLSEKDEYTRFNKVKILTNNSTIYESIKFNLFDIEDIELLPICDSTEFLPYLKSSILAKEDLYIFILVPFDYIDFSNIADFMNEQNIMYCMGFSYDSSLFLSNIHKKEWYNPCPKCLFSHIESSLRAYQKNTTNISFQTIVDLLYNRKILFSPDIPLNTIDTLEVIRYISNLKNQNINISANRIVKFNFIEDSTFDQAIHWELCNCFEESKNE